MVSQSFSANPADIWSEYVSDFANIEQVKDFETEMHFLQSIGLIKMREKDGVIVKLLACNDRIEDYYELLKRKRKKEIVEEQFAFFDTWKEKGKSIITLFCEEQLERVRTGKKPTYSLEVCEKILRILDYILDNTEELLERELSIMLLADSKLFEEKYRNKVCKILRTYIDFEEKLAGIDDAREQEKVILEEFNIFANPSYVYLKGKIRVVLNDGQSILMGGEPIALSSDFIKRMESITIEAKKVVTVENITSFHRVIDDDSAYIYLAGYHNSEKQALLKKIYTENPGKVWLHFGDVDPDGFYILEHLRKGTGIDFLPMNMGICELKKHSKSCKKLSVADQIKAKNLIEKGRYVEVLKYMLENSCKLEQEIISLCIAR